MQYTRANAPSNLALRTTDDNQLGHTYIGSGSCHAIGWDINVGQAWKVYEWPHAFEADGNTLIMPPEGLVGRFVNANSYMQSEPVAVNNALNRYYSV